MRNKIISILFCFILAAGTITTALIKDRYYSENERRTLAKFPEISWGAVRSGKFGDSIEKYLADQFPGRDGWVTVKTVTERALGKKESGGVYFADDGYLIQRVYDLPQKQLEENISSVKALTEAMKEKNIPVRLMPVPTAADILSDKLPAFAPNIDQQTVIRYAEQQGLDVVDVSDALEEHDREYIYYRTDHHWTGLGAYYAYAAWMSAKGKTAEPVSAWTKEQLHDHFLGTSYAKVNYPFADPDVIDAYYKKLYHKVDYNNGSYITDSIYERKYLESKDPYAVFFNSNQASTVVYGEGDGKLLILKDSYANSFAQFVVDDYAETHMIDLRFFRSPVKKYIEEQSEESRREDTPSRL